MVTTIKDIAKESGFSVSTVSRALTDDPHILAATKQKIITLAKKMNYRLDFNASTLVTGNSRSVGIIFPSTQRFQFNPFYLKIISGATGELSKMGYVVTVALAESTEEILRLVQTMSEQAKVNKFIFLYYESNDPIKKYLDTQKLDYVTVGNAPQETGVFIDNDNHYFGKLAGQLAKKKSNLLNPKILFVKSKQFLSFEQERFEGVKHVIPNKATIYPLNIDFDSQKINSSKIIASVKDIDIIIAAQDGLAEFIFDVLLYHQVKIPIITFNNLLPFYQRPKDIYSFDLKPEEIGRVSVQYLFNTKNFNHRQLVLVK